jgi:hypothetical protein
MELKADIVDYMGKMENGVLVLLSINCGGNFSEGTIFYTDENFVITVTEEVEKAIGFPIEKWPGYKDLSVSILKKLIPCKELIGRMDEVDFSSYIDYDGETSFIEDEIDPDDIESIEE